MIDLKRLKEYVDIGFTKEEALELVQKEAGEEDEKEKTDADSLKEEIKNLKQKIADAPIVLMPYEKPKVIHCKDCRYYEWMSNRVPEEQTWYCHNWNAETGKDDYCSYAERRQE